MPPVSQPKSPSSNPIGVLVLGPGLEVRWPWEEAGPAGRAQGSPASNSEPEPEAVATPPPQAWHRGSLAARCGRLCLHWAVASEPSCPVRWCACAPCTHVSRSGVQWALLQAKHRLRHPCGFSPEPPPPCALGVTSAGANQRAGWPPVCEASRLRTGPALAGRDPASAL